MSCPHCRSCQTRKLALATDLGYARFQCRNCRRTFNERTGTPFNFLEMPTDIVFQVVLFRLLFKLSLRDLMHLFLIRGYEFSYETVRDWEERFAPLLADQVRRRRKRRVGRCWYVDETYVKVSGKWCYLYRAIDKQGQLIDSMLSAKRDMAAAQRFFRSAQTVAGRRPEQVTTDGHNSYPRAIAEVLGKKVKHRCSRYKNNRIEQDHRGIKQRYYPMLGFKSFRSAQRFCRSFDELRNYFRPRQRCHQVVPAARRKEQFRTKVDTLQSAFLARS
jgi:putative transposase